MELANTHVCLPHWWTVHRCNETFRLVLTHVKQKSPIKSPFRHIYVNSSYLSVCFLIGRVLYYHFEYVKLQAIQSAVNISKVVSGTQKAYEQISLSAWLH